MRAEHWRDLDFYSQHRNDVCLVVGLGHIGSYITYYLARLGVKKVIAVDFDYVEAHNLPHQFLAESVVADLAEDEKMLKVEVLKKTIDFMIPNNVVEYIPNKIEVSLEDIRQKCIAHGIIAPTCVFVCVDSMEVRKWIFEQYKSTASLFVDVRTGGQYVNIYAIPSGTLYHKYYEASLHSDAEAAPLPCTGTAIIDVASASSAEAVNRFRLWTRGRLQVFHTFNDYSTGLHGALLVRKPDNTAPHPTNQADPPLKDVDGDEDKLEEIIL